MSLLSLKGHSDNVYLLSISFYFPIKCLISKISLNQSIYRRFPLFFDFVYLNTITYVEVIFHSQYFFSIYLCSSIPSMSKTVNMKQRVSRGDFSCPRCIFYYICYFYVEVKNRRSHGCRIVCFGYVHVLPEVRKSSKRK